MSLKLRGFTLIELLVVIAIIGILATVVIGAVNSARTKGADAAIKSNLQALRVESELWYDGNNGYTISGATISSTTCSTASTTNTFMSTSPTVNAIAAIKKQLTQGTDAACYVTSSAWAVSAPLRNSGITGQANGTTSFCVDSNGTAKERVGAVTSAPTGAPNTGC